MFPIIRDFDVTWKQIPKVVAFSQSQKPVALHDFMQKFSQKVERRKAHLTSRYDREVDQLKDRFDKLSKRIQEHTVAFCDDIQHYEQRFRRQYTVRKQMHKDALAKMLKEHKTDDSDYLERQFHETLEKEEARIQAKYEQEFKTKQQTIQHLIGELEDTNNIEDDESVFRRLVTAHHHNLEIIEQQKDTQNSLFEKQKENITANVNAVSERIKNVRDASNRLQASYRDHMATMQNEMEEKHSEAMLQIHDQIAKMKTMISILENELHELDISTPVETRTTHDRDRLIAELVESKQREFEAILDAKTRHLESLLAEIEEAKTTLAKETENQSKESAARKKAREEANEKELLEIASEFPHMYHDMITKAPSQEIRSLLEMKIHTLETKQHPMFEDILFETIKEASEKEIQDKKAQIDSLNTRIMSLYETELLIDTIARFSDQSLEVELNRLKEQVHRLAITTDKLHKSWVDDSPVLDVAMAISYPEVIRMMADECRLKHDIAVERQKLSDEVAIAKLTGEIRSLEKQLESLTKASQHTNGRKIPLPPLKP